MKIEQSTLLQKITYLEDKLMDALLQLERLLDNKLAQMLTGQKYSFDKTDLWYVATINASNMASTSKTVFVKPLVPKSQNAYKDRGKAIMISCKNASISPARPKHSTTRSLPTCHHYGMVGHFRPNCDQLNFSRTWNKKNTPKKDKDVEKNSKSKYVPPHKRQPTQRFVPTCHHCGKSGHIQSKCPQFQALKSKVKKELPKKVTAGTLPPKVHQASQHQ